MIAWLILETTSKMKDWYDIDQLQKLAGVGPYKPYLPQEATESMGAEMGANMSAKRDYERKNNIRPGDKEWFKLYFAKPHLTGEKSME